MHNVKTPATGQPIGIMSAEAPSIEQKLSTATARAEALNGFTKLVDRLGGDGVALLQRFQIDPHVMEDANGLIPYRTMVRLLEQAATDLSCPDFRVKLAAMQGPFKIVGPVGGRHAQFADARRRLALLRRPYPCLLIPPP